MSKTRAEIQAEYDANVQKIKELKQRNIELDRESMLLSDDEQWFTEKIEPVVYWEGRKKIKTEKLIGRIHWQQGFKDEDTDEVIMVSRSEVVRVDGEWDY